MQTHISDSLKWSQQLKTLTMLIILWDLINSKRTAAEFDFITPTVW
jgi:hypothetical protein